MSDKFEDFVKEYEAGLSFEEAELLKKAREFWTLKTLSPELISKVTVATLQKIINEEKYDSYASWSARIALDKLGIPHYYSD